MAARVSLHSLQKRADSRKPFAVLDVWYLLSWLLLGDTTAPSGPSGDVTQHPSSAESWSRRVWALRAVSGTHPGMPPGLGGQWDEKNIFRVLYIYIHIHIYIRGQFKWINACIVNLSRAWRGAASSWSRISDLLGSVDTPSALGERWRTRRSAPSKWCAALGHSTIPRWKEGINISLNSKEKIMWWSG